MRILLFLAVIALATATFVVDYENYPEQIASWENEVQTQMLNTPSSEENTVRGMTDISEREDDEEGDSPFSEGPVAGDDFEDDLDMQLGMDDEDDQQNVIANLDISSLDSTDESLAAEAELFAPFSTSNSAYPTHDYIDLRVKDTVDYGEEEDNGAVYAAATAGEIRDSIALIRQLYQPHQVVQGSENGIEAEIYLRKHLSSASSKNKNSKIVGDLEIGDDELVTAESIGMVNLDVESMENEASKDWGIVEKNFQNVAGEIKSATRYGVESLANWASSARIRLAQTSKKFGEWSRELRRNAKGDWKYVKKQVKHAGQMIKDLMVCPANGNNVAEKTGNKLRKESGVDKDATAYIVIRAHDAVTDWIHAFHHEQVKCNLPMCAGNVHYGFKKSYEAIRNDLVEKAKKLAKEHGVKRFVVSGYSLGGAVALLHGIDALSALPAVSVGVATFGQPKVGDEKFAKFVDNKLSNYPRIVAKFQESSCNCETEAKADYVTSLPAKEHFEHAGQEVSVPCYVGECNTRCCPQSVIQQIKCHALDRYVHSTWSTVGSI